MPETRITVTALHDLTYEGRDYRVGESFEVLAIAAATLAYQRKVSLTSSRRLETQTISPEPAPAVPDLPLVDSPPRRRRRYQRRDLVPEP